MTEERLKEIKDSIDFQLSVCDIPEYETSKLLAEEELELYNEVVRLRKIIDEINGYFFNELQVYGGGGIAQDNYNKIIEIEGLPNTNLTLEQLTGVENE